MSSRNITDRPVFTFKPGDSPLLISMPHVGTYLPPAIAERLTPTARQVPDTDWHLERLYALPTTSALRYWRPRIPAMSSTLNRAPDGASLYPGQSVTGLCPVDSFDDAPIYLDGQVPGDAEIEARRLAVAAVSRRAGRSP